MFLVAGLGNPGLQYERSRHNMGYLTADELSRLWKMPFKAERMQGYFATGKVAGSQAAIIKPTTYMNNSGKCLLEAVTKLKVDLSQFIVVFDDMDLPIGKIRIRLQGGPGTHNGMRSIVYELGSEDFIRIRIGIGMPPDDMDSVNFVLGKPQGDEQKLLDEAIIRASEAVDTIVRLGGEEAMQRFNK
jgi:peptidyl-tRNA hydrolase, PTH1 family